MYFIWLCIFVGVCIFWAIFVVWYNTHQRLLAIEDMWYNNYTAEIQRIYNYHTSGLSYGNVYDSAILTLFTKRAEILTNMLKAATSSDKRFLLSDEVTALIGSININNFIYNAELYIDSSIVAEFLEANKKSFNDFLSSIPDNRPRRIYERYMYARIVKESALEHIALHAKRTMKIYRRHRPALLKLLKDYEAKQKQKKA